MQLGILIKNAQSLEVAHALTTIVPDKTGTITQGAPTVTDVLARDLAEGELLRLVASAKCRSKHPLGEAIVVSTQDRNWN